MDLVSIIVRLTGAREAAVEADALSASMKGIGVSAGAAGKTAAAGLGRISAGLASAGSRMRSAGATMTKGLTLPIVGIGAAAAKTAVDFEKSMRNVNSIAQLPEKQFASLSKQVTALAGPTAQSPQTLSEGLYDLVSSGFNASQSMTILKSSAKAATAGLTTTEVSTKAVAAALNAYHLPASEAGKVSDILFQTVNRGVVTFDALAGSIGGTLPAASTLGVGLDELGASTSTLTKEGQSGESAMVNLNAAMTALFKPSAAMSSAISSLGYENAQSMVKAEGFQGSLEALVGATDGTTESVGKLFPNVRAMRAAFGLTGKNAKSAQQDLKAFGKTTGATNTVFAEQSKSLAFQWSKFTAQLQATAIKIGPPLLAFMGKMVGYLQSAVQWFRSLSPETQKWIGYAAVAVAAAGPLLFILGGLATGLAAVLTPMGGVVLLTLAIAAAFVYAYKKSAKFRTIVTAVINAIKPQIQALVKIVQGAVSLVGGILTGDWAAAWKGAKMIVSGFVGGLIASVQTIAGAFRAGFSALAGIVQAALGPVVNFVQSLIDKIESLKNALPGGSIDLGGDVAAVAAAQLGQNAAGDAAAAAQPSGGGHSNPGSPRQLPRATPAPQGHSRTAYVNHTSNHPVKFVTVAGKVLAEATLEYQESYEARV